MDPGRPQQPDKKQLLQQQQLLLQKQLQQQQQHQQLLKQQQQQQQLNLQQQQLKQQQQLLLQTQSNSQQQQQQQLLQTQPQYLQQQLSSNQQQILIRNQDFLKQRGMQQGNLNQQQHLEHQKNQEPTIIDVIQLNDSDEEKNQEESLTVHRQQVIQQQQQSSLQRHQQLQQLQTQLAQQSQLGHQPQHQQQPQFVQQSQQQFQNVQQLQNVSQLQNSQQLQTVQQPQPITQPQIVQKSQVERQPQAVRQPQTVQKPNSLQQSQIIQQQNNQCSPVSTQQQSKKQPPPHSQQLLQQQLQQLLIKNKNYPQRIVVLGNQQQQQQLSPQQSQRMVTNNGTGQQSQQMQRVVVTSTGQQTQQMQRVVVTGTGQPQQQQQQQQQIQRIVVGSNGQQQPQQVQRVVVPTTVQHQQMQRVVVTSTSQQIQQQQLQHVIPNVSQQQSHQIQNVVSQTSIQQQVQRIVTSTSGQQQHQLAQQNQPLSQRIVIGQLKTSQQTQQMQSPSQNGVVLNQQVMQRQQQQQRVVISGQQQILKLTNQQQSQQQITLQKQMTHKLLQPTQQQQQHHQQQQQQQQQQQKDVVKTQLQQLDVVKNLNQQQDVVKKQQLDVVKNQYQQDVVKKQLPNQQLSKSAVVSLTQQQKNNLNLSNENLAKELHIKQSHQQLQQLHIQPSQKNSQEQINRQLQQQKLKQKKEIDHLQNQLKQSQRSGVIVGQLQQPEKPEPEKLKQQFEIQKQQRQKLQERILLQQQQQQQKKLKEQQMIQKHQQQLREQVLLQQHLKQQQQQQLQQKLLLRQQASSENRISLVVDRNIDQKIQDEEKIINCYEKSMEPESLQRIEKVTAAEKTSQIGIKRKNNENIPVSEKNLLLLSSSDEDDDDDSIRKQRNCLREAERLVQERYDALTVVLGSKYQAQYDEILRNWLASRLSRKEFDYEIRKVMYVSWMDTMKQMDGDKNCKSASNKTKNTSSSKKTAKKTTNSKVKKDIASSLNTTVQKSTTLKKVTEENKELHINIENKEAKAILAERVPLHNALITSLIMWLPLNCQWLEQRKARIQGVSETGCPLRLYTYADVPQVRGSSDHWFPNLPGSLARWYWPNHLSCKSTLKENNENSTHEQEKKEAADALATAVLLKPPSCKLLPLLMEIAENTVKVQRARQRQYQKRYPKTQNVKVMKRLQWQRLQEQKRLATMIRLRDGCSKLLRELKMRLRYLAIQEGRLIERLRRLQIRMSQRRRRVLAQFEIREKDLKSRIRKFFGKSLPEQSNNNSQEYLYSADSSNEDTEPDDDETDEEPRHNTLKQRWKQVHLQKKNNGKKKPLNITNADLQSRPNFQGKRPQPTALTIRLLRDRQQFLKTTRLLQVTKQERLQVSSYADYLREVRNKNCPCGEFDDKPCQYRRQIRQLRKKIRVRELAEIKKEIDRELVKKVPEKEKADSKVLQKKPSTVIQKKKAENQKEKVVTKSSKKTKSAVIKENVDVEAEQKRSITAKDNAIDNISTKTNITSNNNISNKTTSLVTFNTNNVEIKERQTLNNQDQVNKGKHNTGINCATFETQTHVNNLGNTRSWIRPPHSKDKRSVVNVADAAARAAQAALAASKKTQLRKTRAAAAAAAAAATAAAVTTTAAATTTTTVTVTSGKVDDDPRASELMPPPPPPPLPKTSTPRNPTIGARYLQQQKFLLDRHRQLERIRRDEEERRQRAQDEHRRQNQDCSNWEEETSMKTVDVSSQYLPLSQRMQSKRQKDPVGTICQDISRDTNSEEQEEFGNLNSIKSKNEEERRQMNDYYYYYYYGGDDYYSSDEESSDSSYIEPPFPPLLHDLRIDQLPRPMNRIPPAAVLPPGVRSRMQPLRPTYSKNQDVESRASYSKSEVENLQKRKFMESEHVQNIYKPIQKESFDHTAEFSRSLNPPKKTDKNKISESDDSSFGKNLPITIKNKPKKGLQTEHIEQRGQHQLQQGRINNTKISTAQRKDRHNVEKLPGSKKMFEQGRQGRKDDPKPIKKTIQLPDWSKEDLNQVTISSVTKTNSFISEQIKHHPCQSQHRNSSTRYPSNKSQELVTRVEIEELRSVQWKAPLTQWNKRPIAYEAAIKQIYPMQSKEKDVQISMIENVVTCTSAKFQVSNHHLNDQQEKLRSEIERQKQERIKLQDMVFEYQKLVDTLPPNEQLQHMVRLKQHLRPSGNTFEKTSVKCNPLTEQQKLTVAPINNACILRNDSPSFIYSSGADQEPSVLRQIGNLLLKIKNQHEQMYQKVNLNDEIKISSSQGVSDKFHVNALVQNDLKNWCDLWPAYEDKPIHEELMDDEQRLRRTQELIDQYYSSNADKKIVRSLDQQKRRLGKYGRERLERELPEYQQFRTMQSETKAKPNLAEQKITQKSQNLQCTQHNLSERQSCLEQYKRLGRIEQLEQQKHLLGHNQQLSETKIQNKQHQDPSCTLIQQKQSQYCWTVSKFRVSPTLCYDEQLSLHEQLLRRIMKKKNIQILEKHQPQQKCPKSTEIPDTVIRPRIIMPESTSSLNTIREMNRGSQLWWKNIGLQRQISPLVTGSENRDDLELTPIAMMPIGNQPQVTRPQTATTVASIVYIHQKRNAIFSNKTKLKKWLTPRLLNMMTNVEERWLEQLQTKISQLDQQVNLHWKTMKEKQEQQVKLLLNYDKQLQWEKEKKRLERERRIQQLKKRKPFQALPVHHQQAHTSRAVGNIQQQSEIPIIVIDDDDEPLIDAVLDASKRDSNPHPVFINDDLLKQELETKVFYEDQYKGISNQWKQLEVIRKAHQQQWKSKLKMLFSYKATNKQFCCKLNERLMRKIKNPNLIIELEQLNGGALKYTEQQQVASQNQKRSHLNIQGEHKFKKQNMKYSNKNQQKKSNKNQELSSTRQIRSKRTNQLIKQNKQLRNDQMITKVKSPAVSSRHISLLRNRILNVHSNRNKRLRKQNQRSVSKTDVSLVDSENRIQRYEGVNKSTKLILRTLTYSLHNQRSALQRQLDRLNENHVDTNSKQLEPSISKTLMMSIQHPTITSMILPPLQPSTIKQQSLISTVTLIPQRPLTSIEQCSTSSVILIPQLPMQSNESSSCTPALLQSCQQNQLVENKRQAMKQQLNQVHSKLKPLMEMWQLSLRMPTRWLWQQLNDIEQLRRKEFSVKSMLDLGCVSGRQQKQQILQNNEVSVVMNSTTMTQYSLQQLQRIRDHLNWRQQRLRDLIEGFLIMIYPEHPMLSETSQQPSTSSVLIKLQQNPPMTEQINSAYSALLNLQCPSSLKQTQQQFSSYSLLLKLKQPLIANQQSLMYSTLLKLQQPPISKQSESTALISKNLKRHPTISTNNDILFPNNQIQGKKRLSTKGNETNNYLKRHIPSTKGRPLSSINISFIPSASYLPYKDKPIGKLIPTIPILDSDEDVEIIDSDSSTESSNEASFGVQVSEKSPLTIKIIKNKPLLKDLKNKSKIGDINSVVKFKENKINVDLNQDIEKANNEYTKVEKTMQIEAKEKDFKKLIITKDENNKKLTSEHEENNKGLISEKTISKTIVSRPTQIAVLVNRPNESVAVNNEPAIAVNSNQILKVAVVESTSSMISNTDRKTIKVEGRKTMQISGSVPYPAHVNSVGRTIAVINKLTETAVGVIRKAPIINQNQQPTISSTLSPIITPFENSNITMSKSIDQFQSNSNSTENMIQGNKVVTTNHRRRISTLTLLKTVRRHRRLNRTISLETRGLAVPTFRDHGFAQGTIELVVHERFVTTLMTMSAAHTIASYLPPRLPQIPFDYASIYQYNLFNDVPTVKGNNSNVHNTTNNQAIKSAKNAPLTLSGVMGWLKKTVKASSNLACGNGHVWNGCARTNGSTLMTLSKVVKEAISRNNAIRSRATSSSHATTGVKTPTTTPTKASRSTNKKPIPVITNLTGKSKSTTLPTSSTSNSNIKQQITTKRSNSLTSTATPLSLKTMSIVSTPSIKNASSSSFVDGLHNRSKSVMVEENIHEKQKPQSTKRSASMAFSSETLLTSQTMTDVMVPIQEKEELTIVSPPNKRSKSAVINQSPTSTKLGRCEECVRPIKRSASVAEYVSPSITSSMSDLSPTAINPPKRSKSVVVITPVTEATSVSSDNLERSLPVKRSASMALSPPTIRQTNRSNSADVTSSSSNKYPNITLPQPRVSRTIPPLIVSEATPNDTKNNILTNSVIETSDENNTIVEKTTTITEEEQRTVTVTRTLCPTIPAPMDVTADACTLVKAACEQFIKAMVMERHLKAGRGAGTLQLHRRDAYAAAIAADDDIRPFPDYCRTPSIAKTPVNPVKSAQGPGENNVEKDLVFEQNSIVTDSRSNAKSIVMTIDKPDNNNERRAVSKQQSIIVDSKSNNKLSVLTVKTVIETRTTSTTTSTINKMQCPTSITTIYPKKTIEGTSARTRGVLVLKKTRSSAFTPKTTIPSTTEQSTSGQLSSDSTAAEMRAKSSLPVPKTTTKPPPAVENVTKIVTDTSPDSILELLPEATLTFKTSTSTRGFFVERGRPLLRPAFNRRQPFGTLVATCTMASVDTAAVNKTYFSNDRGQYLDSKANSSNNDPFTEAWGCYFGNKQMLPPASRLNNFLNIGYKSVVPSSKNQDRVDCDNDAVDTAHLLPSNSTLTKSSYGIMETNDNSDQDQMLLANGRQQLMFIEIARQKQYMKRLEQEMKQRVQEYQNQEPDPQEIYYQKFMKLQFGNKNTPPEQSLLRLTPNSHSRHSLMSW